MAQSGPGSTAPTTPPSAPLASPSPASQNSQQPGTQPATPPAVQPGTQPAPQPGAPTAQPVPTTSEVVTTTFTEEPPFTASAGYLHQFSAEIDPGAEMSVDRFYASFESRLVQNSDFKLSLGMGYELDAYHWSGTSSLGTNDPFGSVNLLAVQLKARFKLSNEFAVGVSGIFALAGESNAEASDSIYGGGTASVMWTPNDDLLLGVGVLAVTQIEDDVLVLPIPIVHWKISDELVLSTMRRPPASPFIGIDLAWEPKNVPVDVAIGFAWQERRFRLGPNASAALNNGVGEDQNFAMLFMVGYNFNRDIRLDLMTGFTFAEDIHLENSVGMKVRSASLDPAALLGLFLTVRF